MSHSWASLFESSTRFELMVMQDWAMSNWVTCRPSLNATVLCSYYCGGLQSLGRQARAKLLVVGVQVELLKAGPVLVVGVEHVLALRGGVHNKHSVARVCERRRHK